MNDNSAEVAGLIQELLALTHIESIPPVHPLSAEEAEQQQSKRMKVRQALVLALSLRGL
jgi:hypothetical protein